MSVGRREDDRYRASELGPLCRLELELLAAGGGEFIELCFAAELGHAPFGFDPAFAFHSIEGRVERAFFDLDGIAGGILDPSRDGVPVARAPAQCLENERVERAVES